MIVRLQDIPEEGLSLEIKEGPEELKKLAGEADFDLLAPVDASLRVTVSEGSAFISGNIKGRLGLKCGRCLKEYEYPLDADISVMYTRVPETEREKELTAEDMELNYLMEDEIDTTEVVLSQIALELPIQPLCREDCKGLCPRCGLDLNLGPCGCRVEERIDQRFAKLKDLKVK